MTSKTSFHLKVPQNGGFRGRGSQWYKLIRQNEFISFVEIRELFPSADQSGRLTVFNIGGNKVRLIAAIHYNRKKVYIRSVLTHAEYDEERWKE